MTQDDENQSAAQAVKAITGHAQESGEELLNDPELKRQYREAMEKIRREKEEGQ